MVRDRSWGAVEVLDRAWGSLGLPEALADAGAEPDVERACFAAVAHHLLAPDGSVANWVHHDVVVDRLPELPEQRARQAAALLASEPAVGALEDAMVSLFDEVLPVYLVTCASGTGLWMQAAVAPGGWPVLTGVVPRTAIRANYSRLRQRLSAVGLGPVAKLSQGPKFRQEAEAHPLRPHAEIHPRPRGRMSWSSTCTAMPNRDSTADIGSPSPPAGRRGSGITRRSMPPTP